MPISTDIVGKMVKFPFQIKNGNVQMQPSASQSQFVEAINQRYTYILGTLVGERVPRRNWGSYTKLLLFRPIGSPDTIAKLEFFAKQALEQHEKSVFVTFVSIDVSRQDEGILLVDVRYAETKTNRSGRLAYPFMIGSPSVDLIIER